MTYFFSESECLSDKVFIYSNKITCVNNLCCKIIINNNLYTLYVRIFAHFHLGSKTSLIFTCSCLFLAGYMYIGRTYVCIYLMCMLYSIYYNNAFPSCVISNQILICLTCYLVQIPFSTYIYLCILHIYLLLLPFLFILLHSKRSK